MKCPKCGSENTGYEVINEVHLKKKRGGLLYWLTIGPFILIFKLFSWMIFTLPMLIISIFKPKSYKTINKRKKIFKCNSCGYIK